LDILLRRRGVLIKRQEKIRIPLCAGFRNACVQRGGNARVDRLTHNAGTGCGQLLQHRLGSRGRTVVNNDDVTDLLQQFTDSADERWWRPEGSYHGNDQGFGIMLHQGQDPIVRG
jgi:hypothetical protein